MCFVCDGIAETCGWQRAQKLGSALEAYFAKWEEPTCQHCDEGLAEFVDELTKTRDQSCQAGETCQVHLPDSGGVGRSGKRADVCIAVCESMLPGDDDLSV